MQEKASSSRFTKVPRWLEKCDKCEISFKQESYTAIYKEDVQVGT